MIFWFYLQISIAKFAQAVLNVITWGISVTLSEWATLRVTLAVWSYSVCCKKKVKVAHTRLPSVGFRSWSRFLAVSLQVTWVINPTVGCHYFPPGLQLPPQPLRGLVQILLLDEQRHDRCEQFTQHCYPTASRLRFQPGPFCTLVQHANHSATEPRHLL